MVPGRRDSVLGITDELEHGPDAVSINQKLSKRLPADFVADAVSALDTVRTMSNGLSVCSLRTTESRGRVSSQVTMLSVEDKLLAASGDRYYSQSISFELKLLVAS